MLVPPAGQTAHRASERSLQISFFPAWRLHPPRAPRFTRPATSHAPILGPCFPLALPDAESHGPSDTPRALSWRQSYPATQQVRPHMRLLGASSPRFATCAGQRPAWSRSGPCPPRLLSASVRPPVRPKARWGPPRGAVPQIAGGGRTHPCFVGCPAPLVLSPCPGLDACSNTRFAGVGGWRPAPVEVPGVRLFCCT